MPHVTTQLGNEAGIQYQGVLDASSNIAAFPVVGLITGKFRRGRYDKPMIVNLRNIRALLGHDAKNQDYLAVLNALNDGVPNVHVLRIGDLVDDVPIEETYCANFGFTESRSWYVDVSGNNVSIDEVRSNITVKINSSDVSHTLSLDGSSIKLAVTSIKQGQTMQVCLNRRFDLNPEAW